MKDVAHVARDPLERVRDHAIVLKGGEGQGADGGQKQQRDENLEQVARGHETQQ